MGTARLVIALLLPLAAWAGGSGGGLVVERGQGRLAGQHPGIGADFRVLRLGDERVVIDLRLHDGAVAFHAVLEANRPLGVLDLYATAGGAGGERSVDATGAVRKQPRDHVALMVVRSTLAADPRLRDDPLARRLDALLELLAGHYRVGSPYPSPSSPPVEAPSAPTPALR